MRPADLNKTLASGENLHIEFWFARDLQAHLGYARWENFQTVTPHAFHVRNG